MAQGQIYLFYIYIKPELTFVNSFPKYLAGYNYIVGWLGLIQFLSGSTNAEKYFSSG
jgi:hypothetical protein